MKETKNKNKHKNKPPGATGWHYWPCALEGSTNGAICDCRRGLPQKWAPRNRCRGSPPRGGRAKDASCTERCERYRTPTALPTRSRLRPFPSHRLEDRHPRQTIAHPNALIWCHLLALVSPAIPNAEFIIIIIKNYLFL